MTDKASTLSGLAISYNDILFGYIKGGSVDDITPHSGAQVSAMTQVQHLYDQDTSTFTYVVSDPNSGLAALTMSLLRAPGEARGKSDD